MLLCVNYTLAFDIHILGEIDYEMIPSTRLIRSKLLNVHGVS
jgi:hypothetical protein